MKHSVFSMNDFKKNVWSGGTTTELFISPSSASYIDRHFDLRLSTASVESKSSTFTSLPGIDRKLMVLEGEIMISHEGHYSKKLKPFDVDAFKGEWNTSAIGKCTDFNVMTRGKLKSELSSLHFTKKSDFLFDLEEGWRKVFFFLTKGSISIIINQNNIQLYKDDLLCIDDITQQKFSIVANEISQLVLVKIK